VGFVGSGNAPVIKFSKHRGLLNDGGPESPSCCVSGYLGCRKTGPGGAAAIVAS
jgi:hypothetical protein